MSGVAASTGSAFVVARWFIVKAAATDAELSNLKLQKLLYYAQGRYLARTGRPLFPQPIEAWDHGPVVSAVYHACKGHGSGSVDVDISSWSIGAIDREAERILDAVWAEEGGLAAWKLRQMTHHEPPWRDHYAVDSRHVVIPNDAILRFFRGQHLAPSLSIDEALAEWADESHQIAEDFLPDLDAAEW